MSQEKPTPAKSAALQAWLSRKTKATAAPQLEPQNPSLPAVLSYGQQRLWLLQQLFPDNSFYHYAHLYRFDGPLDLSRLQQSLRGVMDRHAILRTCFQQTDEGPRQWARTEAELEFVLTDLSDLPAEQQQRRAHQIALQAARQPFDLTTGPLWRFIVLRFSPARHWLVLVIHHIIGDRWSLEVINQELSTLYQQGTVEAADLPDLPFQYADYARRQRERKVATEDLDYWLQQLSGELPILSLPTDLPRPPQPSYRGEIISRSVSAELSNRIRVLAKEEQTTLFVVLLAAFKALLYRYTGQTDILVGSPFSNRDKAELENMVGFFNETLVLRSTLTADMSFQELIQQVKRHTLDALKHQQVPFEKLVQELQPERGGAHNPLFQVMFLYHTAVPAPSFGKELKLSDDMLDHGVSKFDLTLNVQDGAEELQLSLEYAKDLFHRSTIKRMLEHLSVLLEGLSRQPTLPPAKAPLLQQTEQHRLLVEWNETGASMPEVAGIHELIAEQVRLHPERIAVTYEQDELTYRELDRRAYAVAQRLMAVGVQPNMPVGLYCRRSTELLVGVYGILKAGAAYLPLDPDYPDERIDFMVTDARAAVVLHQADFRPNVNSSSELNFLSLSTTEVPDEAAKQLLPTPSADNLAYIIYTSGSTGRPKGVPITHRNLIYSTAARFHFYPEDPTCFLLLSSFSFDSSVAGIFWTLSRGGTLVLPKKRIEQDLEELALLIQRRQVSHTLLLPSLYTLLLAHTLPERLRSLRAVMVAGEACPATLIQQHYSLLPATRLYNEYGPTEATVWCIAHHIQPGELAPVPIGRPIANTRVYILDELQQPVPIGVAGVLYIAGPGVAEGYLHRPELSSERFLPDTFVKDKNERMYRTGDLARYRTDGLIEFLGRADHQVKIRGHRVEPEEISARLLGLAGVEEAVVIVEKNTEQAGAALRLIAYISGVGAAQIDDLRQMLRSQLPDYMVPAVIVPLPQLPRLPNGKIDRQALPAPEQQDLPSQINYQPPANAVETQLVDIWQQVLRIDRIGVRDNFFAIGGDSILSIQIVAQARKAGLPLAANELFEHQTIAELARSLSARHLTGPAAGNGQSTSDLPAEITEVPLTELQQAFLFNSRQSADDQGHLQLQFELHGPLQVGAFQQAWQLTVQRHASLRSRVKLLTGHIPLQWVESTAHLPWQVVDWQEWTAAEQQKRLEAYWRQDRDLPLNLEQAPVSRMALFTLAPDRHILCWTCHHLFLDGWSGGIILKDALLYYEALAANRKLQLPAIPSYPVYLSWQTAQDTASAQTFWTDYLADFDCPLLFSKQEGPDPDVPFGDLVLQLDVATSTALRTFARQHQLTLNHLLKGLWAIICSRYFGVDDVLIGTTVSGRSRDFPAIEQMSGLFMNVVPSRLQIEPEHQLIEWLIRTQRQQARIQAFEHTPLEAIRRWIDWPGHLTLFEVLFVFGNFLKDGLKVGDLSVADFSGGFSSNYPLTIRVNPLKQIEFHFRYRMEHLSTEQVSHLSDQWSELLQRVVEPDPPQAVGQLREQLQVFATIKPLLSLAEHQQRSARSLRETADADFSYQAPGNEWELQLCRVWEEVLDRSPIGITDDFFALGGNSLSAVRLFAHIEQEFGRRLPATALLERPTIESLAELLAEDLSTGERAAFSSLVPLKSQGDRPPLFCIHSGGAHVFFYTALANHLEEDRPLYALQPQGIDGEAEHHDSIAAMAAHYIQEIKKVQPDGPYHLLGTCFSNAVVLEMAQQLHQSGEPVERLFIIDSGPLHLFGTDADLKHATLQRFWDLLRRGEWRRIRNKLAGRLGLRRKKTELPATEADASLGEMIDALNRAYAQYTWQPYPGRIYFIRSSEFHQRADKRYHLRQWRRLAGGGLEVAVVPGHHLTLFEEPEVQGLARQIEVFLGE